MQTIYPAMWGYQSHSRATLMREASQAALARKLVAQGLELATSNRSLRAPRADHRSLEYQARASTIMRAP